MCSNLNLVVASLDYQFHFDERNRPIAEFSMGHEVFGTWFTDELRSNTHKIMQLLQMIETLEQRSSFEQQMQGMEHQLTLTRDDVEISPLHESLEEIPEDAELSEEGSFAQCGLPDFKQALISWQAFLAE
jgi:uncharacterized protein YacL (UPF0231 family)